MTVTSSVGARRPRLLFVNAHYHPDVASTGQHLTDLHRLMRCTDLPPHTAEWRRTNWSV